MPIRFLTILSIAGPVLWAAAQPDLLTAIRNGDHAQANQFLRAGTDANSADRDGTTALMHAVIESDVKMMQLLIDRGANVSAKNAFDSTALLYAATSLAKTRLLLDAGAEVKVTGPRGATPLSVAVTAFGSTPVLKLLIAKGAQPEDRLMTPVAQKGDLEAIRYLLGVGVHAGDATTLSAAVSGRCEACVRLLVELQWCRRLERNGQARHARTFPISAGPRRNARFQGSRGLHPPDAGGGIHGSSRRSRSHGAVAARERRRSQRHQ
jgi:hypothetical protein